MAFRPFYAVTGLVLAAGLLTAAPPARAGHHGLGWQGGFERMVYRVQWGYLTVGKAIIQARSPAPGQAEFLTETCTDGTVDALYEERDRLVAHSRYTPEGWRTEAFRAALEKNSKNQTRQYRFAGNGVVYIRDLISGNNDYRPVTPGTLDVLTALFAVRSRQDLEVGNRFSLPVLDRGQPFRLHVVVQGREHLSTGLGEQTTTVRLGTYLEEEGTGRHERPLQVWLTDDRHRVPVRVVADAPVASIRLELRKIRVRAPADPQIGLDCD